MLRVLSCSRAFAIALGRKCRCGISRNGNWGASAWHDWRRQYENARRRHDANAEALNLFVVMSVPGTGVQPMSVFGGIAGMATSAFPW